MNGSRDDEYDSLSDLMGGDPDTDGRPGGDPEDPESSGGSDPAADPRAESDAGPGVDPGTDSSPDLPPGLPPEYADYYRAGYERGRHWDEPTQAMTRPTFDDARDDAAGAPEAEQSQPPEPQSQEPTPAPGHEPTRQIEVGQVPPPLFADEVGRAGRGDTTVPSDPSPGRSARTSPGRSAWTSPGESTQPVPAVPTYDEEAEERRRPPLAVLVLAGLAVLVVLGAFGIGRLLADNAADSEAGDGGSGAGEKGGAEPYQGSVEAATIAKAAATCQAGSSVDAAGNPTTYEPANAYDSNLTTAWRCNGSGKGQRLTVTLPEETKIAEVGLVPGYAKTDPASGANRYAENNRITRVRWTFDDGSSFVQRMSGSARDRSMRTMRVPATTTRQVVMEILASKRGPRNTVAVSEIRLARSSG